MVSRTFVLWSSVSLGSLRAESKTVPQLLSCKISKTLMRLVTLPKYFLLSVARLPKDRMDSYLLFLFKQKMKSFKIYGRTAFPSQVFVSNSVSQAEPDPWPLCSVSCLSFSISPFCTEEYLIDESSFRVTKTITFKIHLFFTFYESFYHQF